MSTFSGLGNTGCTGLADADYATVGRGLMLILSRHSQRAIAIRDLLIAEVMDTEAPGSGLVSQRTIVLDC